MSEDLLRKLECQKCLKWLHIPRHRRGDFSVDVYAVKSGVNLPLLKHVGFCRTCNEFVWMERFPLQADVQNIILKYREDIKKFHGGESWLGQPTCNFYLSVVEHKDEWLNLLASRSRPVCLSCGTYDADPVSEYLIKNVVGDIGVQHGICGGNIFGSFVKDPSDIHICHSRFNRDAPLEFNEYSSQGHKLVLAKFEYIPLPPATRPSVHFANPLSSELLFDAAHSPTFAPRAITDDERAKRADIPQMVRRIANIGDWEIELIDGAILWNRNRIPLASVAGLSWQTSRSDGEGWIRLRVENEVLEARWDVKKQLSEQNEAQQLVGMLLLELRYPIVEAIAQRLANGGHEHLGDAVLKKEGLQLKAQGLWRNKDFLCPWREVETEIGGGTVSITCISRRVAPVRVGLDVENAFALHFLPSRMFSR